MQKKFGEDKLGVLLVSIDKSYGGGMKRAEEQAKKIFEKAKVQWTNAFDPDGWDGVRRNFNLDGYGLTLIGPDGVVLAVNARPERVEKLLAKIQKRAAKSNENAAESQPADAPGGTRKSDRD